MVRLTRTFGLAIASLLLLAGNRAPDWSWREDPNIVPVVTEQNYAPATLPVLSETMLADDSVTYDAVSQAAPGSETLRELVEATASITEAELSEQMTCLATAVYFEARGEPLEGQLAVANVILNRVGNPSWPSNICGVVNQRANSVCQFSFACDGRADIPSNQSAWRTSKAVALIAASRSWDDVSKKATYFHAVQVSPSWRHRFEMTRKLGRHVFYRHSS